MDSKNGKICKVFSSNFSGVSNIKSKDGNQIKIMLNSKLLANKFLPFLFLQNIDFTAYIPATPDIFLWRCKSGYPFFERRLAMALIKVRVISSKCIATKK